jgi:hypothetical protein
MTMEALAERIEALELGTPPLPSPVGAAEPARLAEPAPSLAEPTAADTDTSPKLADSAPPSEEGSPEPVRVTPVRHSGPLDRATVRRNWQAVLAEVKKASVSRAGTFTNVEVDVDADGGTLVVEFPADQRHAMGMAERPDNRELLRGALSRVFGVAPPFRFQLGRGAVRPAESSDERIDEPAASERSHEAAPDTEVPVDEGPIPEYYETATGLTEPIEMRTSQPSTGLQDVLDSLGAHIVAEHPHDPDGKEE